VTNLRVGVQVLRECIARAGSLEAGLRFYVGAANLADDGGYARKVMAEHDYLRQVAAGKPVSGCSMPVAALARLAIGPGGARGGRPPGSASRSPDRSRRSPGHLFAWAALDRCAFSRCRLEGPSSPEDCHVRPQQSTIAHVDPEIWAAIQAENRRQEEHIELIASENYTSPAVMAAQGSQLTNKYAEGYPGKRYYGGCEHVDVVEQLAIDRLKQLFGAEPCANVQANSGSQANQAVFFGLLQPGDTIMGMSLAEGGHLTHGMPLNMSGKWFKVVSYGLDAKEAIDYDAMERLAHEHKPKLIIAGASRPTACASTSSASPRWPRPSARSSWSTWRTTPA
jgi:hypothetical protein